MRVEPNGLRFRHFYDISSGRLVGTICTLLINPTTVVISAAICSPKDNPSKKKGRMIAQKRMNIGKSRTMDRTLLKEEIKARTILEWFDCGSQTFVLR
jgi:hypothetical protein